MNASFSGMDPEAIRQLGSQLRQSSSELAKLSGSVNRLMEDTQASWRGPDVEQFRSKWRDSGRLGLAAMSEDIDSLGRIAIVNAEDQVRISGGGGGSAWGGASPWGGSPGFGGFSGIFRGFGGSGSFSEYDIFKGINGALDAKLGWTEYSARDFLFLVPGGGAVGGANLLGESYFDPNASNADKFLATTAYGSDMLRDIPVPVVALGAAAVSVYTLGAQTAMETDFSPQGFQTVIDYVTNDPATAIVGIGASVGDAVLTVANAVVPPAINDGLNLVVKGVKSFANLFGGN